MTHNLDIIQNTATETGLAPEVLSDVVDALRKVMIDSAEKQQSIIIPRFGSFDAVKEDECVSTDITTGKRVLLPPHIKLQFTPAAMLRRRISEQ